MFSLFKNPLDCWFFDGLVITILTSRIVTLSLKKLNNEEHKFELQILPYDAFIFFLLARSVLYR